MRVILSRERQDLKRTSNLISNNVEENVKALWYFRGSADYYRSQLSDGISAEIIIIQFSNEIRVHLESRILMQGAKPVNTNPGE